MDDEKAGFHESHTTQILQSSLEDETVNSQVSKKLMICPQCKSPQTWKDGLRNLNEENQFSVTFAGHVV